MDLRICAKKIYVSFRPLKTCSSMLVRDGIIIETGNGIDNPVQNEDDTETIDLSESIIMPGFVDAHMHMDDFGKSLATLDLRGTISISEVRQKVSTADKKGWILGHGWDQDLFDEKRWPSRTDIDDVSDDSPVFLSRVDLHSALLNTKAMEILRIEELFSGSSEIMRDEHGIATGIVSEHVFDYADTKVKEMLAEEVYEDMLELAVKESSRLGVTSVGFMSCSLRQLDYFSRLRKAGKLKTRIHAYLSADELDDFTGFENDDFLKVSGIKQFSDGSLGSRTALLSFEYKDDHGNSGIIRESGSKLLNSARKAEEKGLQVATHAIGDLALDTVLDVYSKLRGKHRIEHASLVRKDQIRKIKELGVTLVVQPHFIITDFWTLDRIGRENSEMAYPLRTLKDAGIPMAFSTDCPVEKLNPWETVYAAVTRGVNEKIPLGSVSSNECLTLEDSLWLYTQGSASALSDHMIGALEKGKYADFLVLERDPFSVDPAELCAMGVKETWIAGKRTWSDE